MSRGRPRRRENVIYSGSDWKIVWIYLSTLFSEPFSEFNWWASLSSFLLNVVSLLLLLNILRFLLSLGLFYAFWQASEIQTCILLLKIARFSFPSTVLGENVGVIARAPRNALETCDPLIVVWIILSILVHLPLLLLLCMTVCLVKLLRLQWNCIQDSSSKNTTSFTAKTIPDIWPLSIGISFWTIMIFDNCKFCFTGHRRQHFFYNNHVIRDVIFILWPHIRESCLTSCPNYVRWRQNRRWKELSFLWNLIPGWFSTMLRFFVDIYVSCFSGFAFKMDHIA